MQYEIGGKKYFQKKIVLGQIEQLLDLLQGMEIPASRNPWIVRGALKDKIYLALAIALVEEGKTPKRDSEELAQIADGLKWAIDPETVLQVIEDFFELNPLSSLLKKLEGIVGKMEKAGIQVDARSLRPSSSSPEATSPDETISSGASPSESASPS